METGTEPSGPRREGIPEEVRREVFRRDGGRCAACGSDELLQFDHVIPVALGGASTAANLQVLCAPCNREKGASL
jgi:5-methylcytosine-specific restriction endonuclease McrA